MCPRWRISKCKGFEWAALCVRSSDIDFRPASLTLCTRNARSICINCTYNARITFGKLSADPAVLSADALAGKIFWLSRIRSTRVINTPRIINFICGHYREPHAARQIARARTVCVQFAHRPWDPFNLPEATIALTPIPMSLYLSGTALRVRSLSLSYSRTLFLSFSLSFFPLGARRITLSLTCARNSNCPISFVFTGRSLRNADSRPLLRKFYRPPFMGRKGARAWHRSLVLQRQLPNVPWYPLIKCHLKLERGMGFSTSLIGGSSYRKPGRITTRPSLSYALARVVVHVFTTLEWTVCDSCSPPNQPIGFSTFLFVYRSRTEHCLEISAVTAAAVAISVKSADRTLRVH